jgi:4-amino-4-deoxy-L-arabinose transferase-like glycosyltransferase
MKNLFLNSWLHLSLLLIISIFFLTRGITKPFIGIHDFNGVDYGISAKNNLKFGLQTTKLGMMEVAGESVTPAKFSYYTHHPALLVLLISLSYFLLGISEWATRLVPICFSLASVVGIYMVGKTVGNKWIGLAAGLFFIATPMFLYYGKIPAHEPLLLALGIWLGYAYIIWLQGKDERYYHLMLGLTLGVGLTGWPGYFFIPGMLLHCLLFNRKQFGKLAILPVILILTFGIHLGHLKILTNDFFGGGFKDVFLFRANQTQSVQTQIIGFTWLKYIQQEFKWFLAFFTKPFIGLVCVNIFLTVLAFIKTKTVTKEAKAILLFLLMAVGYPLVFSNAVFIHDYLNIYLLPFVVLSAGTGLFQLTKVFVLSEQLYGLISILVVLLSGFSGWNFYQALQNSTNSQSGRDLAIAVNNLTKPSEKVLVEASQFRDFYGRFAQFYSDRTISFSNHQQENWQQEIKGIEQQYTYIITVDNHLPDSSIVGDLDGHYPTTKLGEFNFYKLKPKD